MVPGSASLNKVVSSWISPNTRGALRSALTSVLDRHVLVSGLTAVRCALLRHAPVPQRSDYCVGRDHPAGCRVLPDACWVEILVLNYTKWDLLSLLLWWFRSAPNPPASAPQTGPDVPVPSDLVSILAERPCSGGGSVARAGKPIVLAVVCGEDHHRIVAKSTSIKCGNHLSRAPITLMHEVAVKETPWIHRDMVGPAYLESDKPHFDGGGPGAMVRTPIQVARRRA